MLDTSLEREDMKAKEHPLVIETKQGMLGQANALRRALIEESGKAGFRKSGTSLAGGRRLIRTYTAAQADYLNPDRFKKQYVEPDVDAGASVMLDISGSMTDKLRSNGYTLIENVMASAIALSGVLDRLNVHHRIGGVDVEYDDEAERISTRCGGTSGGVIGVIYPLSKPSGKGLAYPHDSLMKFPANGSTYIATYAEVAVEEARKIRAKNRVAIYMTDGCCSSSHYLRSIEEQAKRDNITLVGVVMGPPKMRGEADRHPNGIYAKDAIELSRVVLGHLAKAIRGK